jgi:hypothetical protein
MIRSSDWSFAGMSLSSLGDVNEDGYDDIVIGSLPYQGGYIDQRSYMIYGERNRSNIDLSSAFSSMTVAAAAGGGGIKMIIGGGIVVTGLHDDYNDDGINDIMITSYQDWQSKSGSYLLIYPKKKKHDFTFFPTNLPSSSPSNAVIFPTEAPSTDPTLPTLLPSHPTMSPTEAPSGPTLQPSLQPSSPTLSPSIEPTKAPLSPSLTPTKLPTHKPSFRPSASSRPTIEPSFVPSKATRVPTATSIPTLFPSLSPSLFISWMPSRQQVTTDAGYSITIIDDDGEYTEVKEGNFKYVIDASSNVKLTPYREPIIGPRRTPYSPFSYIYKILSQKSQLVKKQVVITITDWQLEKDILDFNDFLNYHNVSDLSYSRDPLTFYLSSSYSVEPQPNEETIVILSSLSSLEQLSSMNFLFSPLPTFSSSSSSVWTTDLITAISIFGGFTFLWLVFFRIHSLLVMHHKKKKKKQQQKQQQQQQEKEEKAAALPSLQKKQIVAVAVDVEDRDLERGKSFDLSSSCSSSPHSSSSYHIEKNYIKSLPTFVPIVHEEEAASEETEEESERENEENEILYDDEDDEDEDISVDSNYLHRLRTETFASNASLRSFAFIYPSYVNANYDEANGSSNHSSLSSSPSSVEHNNHHEVRSDSRHRSSVSDHSSSSSDNSSNSENTFGSDLSSVSFCSVAPVAAPSVIVQSLRWNLRKKEPMSSSLSYTERQSSPQQPWSQPHQDITTVLNSNLNSDFNSTLLLPPPSNSHVIIRNDSSHSLFSYFSLSDNSSDEDFSGFNNTNPHHQQQQ